MMNAHAEIGHNNPPEETPYQAAYHRLAMIHMEAENWLDGEVAENQAQVDELSRILAEARAAKKQADDARKAEAKPFDDGKKEVQARYKPLLTNADLIADGCKAAMAPFMAKVEAEKRERERRKQAEAEAARREAEKALAEANASDLAAREEAIALSEEADRKQRAATAAAKDKARGAGEGRAVTLRSDWKGEVSDLTAAARHYWPTAKDEFAAVIDRLVAADVRRGVREIPGVTITEQKTVV